MHSLCKDQAATGLCGRGQLGWNGWIMQPKVCNRKEQLVFAEKRNWLVDNVPAPTVSLVAKERESEPLRQAFRSVACTWQESMPEAFAAKACLGNPKYPAIRDYCPSECI